MATKSENVEIAVLQEQMETVKEVLKQVNDDTKSIRTSVDNLPTIYATKIDLSDHAKSIKEDIKAYKSSDRVNRVVQIIVTATITALLYYFISHGNFIG